MGFDVYGLNPINTMGIEKPVHPTGLWDAPKEVQNTHWKAVDAYAKAVPGDYWRSNVWWWRTLWTYTCEVCQDVMSDKHMDAGSSNDGMTVPKTTAIRMAKKLKKAEDSGVHTKYEKNHTKWMKALPKEKCFICDGVGLRMDNLGMDERKKDPTYKCNGCQGEGYKRSFMANYPFKAEVAVDFRKFIEQSGGFQVW